MSTMANQRNTSEEGLIKHIMAHDAHKGIDDRLLALRKEDNAVVVDVIYTKRLAMEDMSKSRLGSAMQSNGTKRNNYAAFDFASKFTVKTSGASHSSESRSTVGWRKTSSHHSSHHSNGSEGSTSKPLLSSRRPSISHSKRPSEFDSIAEIEPENNSDAESVAEITP